MFDSDPVDRGIAVLRLHTDLDGVVWYGTDALPFESTGASVADFYRDPDGADVGLDRAAAVRVLGTADNAALLLGLKKYHTDRPKLAAKQTVLLGSPQVVPSPVLKASAAAVLQAMWQPSPSATTAGCWHRMGKHEYTTYAICHELKMTAGQPSELARRTLRYHPAWPALSFLAGLNEDAACRLIAEVVEPRWFRHPFRPTRLSRLHSYLGINPGNMAAFVGAGEPGHNYHRSQTVLETWAFGYKSSMKRAGGFLHRIAERSRDGEYHVGLLRASTRFARFLFEVWTAESASHPDVRFDPDMFFKRPEDAADYAAHRSSLRV